MACGSDALTRLEIMRLAEQRALERAGAAGFFTRTYVGDAVWDVKAAAALEYRFIGVAAQERAAALRRAGAEHVLPHFEDLPRFLRLLEAIWAGPASGR
jgi:phosphoglycolate phosphatase-like HAD superfamily hydrolase